MDKVRRGAPKWYKDKRIRLAREVACPVCLARKGKPCPGVKFGFHRNRSELARRERLRKKACHAGGEGS